MLKKFYVPICQKVLIINWINFLSKDVQCISKLNLVMRSKT
ncbi:hypothetical protein P689_119157 [Candidatus Riesia pediculischaeffi PTSU]|uniref:Uncharacterized protein n=1 Tax=Candidatus Riesia pediculischaeffi PTSU TaxID=1401651 RepID=A0A0C1SA78_9ENTR|nr:hypothetical protein P689_119157 [Candidatus Riesia pediculischaeffi PTSU]